MAACDPQWKSSKHSLRWPLLQRGQLMQDFELHVRQVVTMLVFDIGAMSTRSRPDIVGSNWLSDLNRKQFNLPSAFDHGIR